MKSERIFLIIFAMLVLISAVILMLSNINPNFSITGFVAEGRLPTIGESNWGTLLNTYLTQEHTAEGGHKNVTVQGSLDVDGNGNFTGNLNVTGNLTIGDKITFKFGEIIDNIIDSWIQITGNLNVIGDLNVSGEINSTGLNVDGNANITGNLTVGGNTNIIGNLSVSEIIDIDLELVSNSCDSSTTCTVNCPTGKRITGGGCHNAGGANFPVAYPASITSWQCDSSAIVNILAVAICAKIK